jgi:hypothetical protein
VAICSSESNSSLAERLWLVAGLGMLRVGLPSIRSGTPDARGGELDRRHIIVLLIHNVLLVKSALVIFVKDLNIGSDAQRLE